MSPAVRVFLGIDKAREGGEPVPVLRELWNDGLPAGEAFLDAFARAYASIEPPFVPCAAWVEAFAPFASRRFDAVDARNSASVATALWGAASVAAAELGG